ncbi:MAG TPA: ribbon-helix-helix domain-containing protein [Ktedonobacterales bacterium]
MAHDIRRITVTLPSPLLTAIDDAVRSGVARSRCAFVTDAVRQALAAIKHAEIDAAFAAMATDEAYQREALQIAAEFERASWDALQRPTP